MCNLCSYRSKDASLMTCIDKLVFAFRHNLEPQNDSIIK